MIPGVSTIALALSVAVGALGLTVGGGVGYWARGNVDEPYEFEGVLEENSNHDGRSVTLPAPDVSGGWLDVFRQRQHRKKEKKLAKRGYVKWFKFDGMLRAPEWVRPERGGSGAPKYYDRDDGVHYLFPEDALVTDARTGAPVAVHHSGEVEPVNLKEPAHPPIDADRLEEIINLEIESDPPGWLSKFDLDAQTMMYASIVLILIFAGAQQVM